MVKQWIRCYSRLGINSYSDWMAVPRSIKTTSVKPSGTVSLLAGATPGLHYPESRFYIRRIRLSKHSELLEPLKKAGYLVEPAFGSEDTTMVVEVPVDVGEGIRTASNSPFGNNSHWLRFYNDIGQTTKLVVRLHLILKQKQIKLLHV